MTTGSSTEQSIPSLLIAASYTTLGRGFVNPVSFWSLLGLVSFSYFLGLIYFMYFQNLENLLLRREHFSLEEIIS